MTQLVCPNCGANVPYPTDPGAISAACPHCNSSVPLRNSSDPLGAEGVEARQRQEAAPEPRRHEAANLEDAGHTRRSKRLVWALGAGGFLVVVAGLVAFMRWRDRHDQREQRETLAEQVVMREQTSKQRIAELRPLLNRLRQRGCYHQVELPRTVVGSGTATLDMKKGGNCLHVVVATPGSFDVKLVVPSGKTNTAKGQGTLDFEHCPAETGQYVFQLHGAESNVLGYAMVDCSPTLEQHKENPLMNALKRAQAHLGALEKLGCDRVTFAPQAMTGDHHLTAKMDPKGPCAIFIATAGSDDNLLSMTLKPPTGKSVTRPPASEVELAYCATILGDHTVSVTPQHPDHFALAGMDCPRAAVLKRGADPQ